ncbi:MAG TPA: NosD domain-containing protein, partial [Oscillospiraceae bacterium]|nr:NosD domain-containing protein [Oscillospiraceae bacterium]
FTDTITTINGKTGAIVKADIVALGIPAQDTVVDISGKIDKVAGKGLSTEDYTTAEKTKLAGIAASANNYSHPPTHPASMITQDANNRFVTDAEKAVWNSPPGTTGKKVARFVVGTSTAGWTDADCDYLCDGTADQTEINAAITALPATGGEIIILDGTYNITAKIDVTKDNVSIRGNGNATILKRMFNSTSTPGVIALTGRSGCNVANLQVDGNSASFANLVNSGISLDSSSNNTIIGNTCNNNNSYGIRITDSSNNTVTGNTCSSNEIGILLFASSNNTVTGNTCTRGTGLPTDYTASQNTIWLGGTGNNYNLISNNNCMGKAPRVDGGTGNSVYGNKYDSGNYKDFTQDEKTKLAGISEEA